MGRVPSPNPLHESLAECVSGLRSFAMVLEVDDAPEVRMTSCPSTLASAAKKLDDLIGSIADAELRLAYVRLRFRLGQIADAIIQGVNKDVVYTVENFRSQLHDTLDSFVDLPPVLKEVRDV